MGLNNSFQRQITKEIIYIFNRMQIKKINLKELRLKYMFFTHRQCAGDGDFTYFEYYHLISIESDEKNITVEYYGEKERDCGVEEVYKEPLFYAPISLEDGIRLFEFLEFIDSHVIM